MGSTVAFDNSADYERFMGRWSRAAAASFLAWLAPPSGLRWLDVGCGTGVFARSVVESSFPSFVVGVDASAAQIEYAKCLSCAAEIDFHVADAEALAFDDATFDVVVSALVINFIRNRPRALAEMRRVTCPGGIVAAYVWDFAGGRSPTWPLVRAMSSIGIDGPKIPAAKESSADALMSMFKAAGFEQVASASLDLTISFTSFEEFWVSQTPPFSPIGELVGSLPLSCRTRLEAATRVIVPFGSSGTVVYSARANAVKARVPTSS